MEAEQKHRITVEFTDFEWKMLQAACAYDGMSVEEFVKAHTKLAVASALEAAGKKNFARLLELDICPRLLGSAKERR